MTSGVPFHYAGNVKAQLSQWLYPWCKGNSVISFFPPPSLSLFPSFFFPFSSVFLLSTVEIFIGTANRVLFVSEVHAARPLVTSRFRGEADDGTRLKTFHGSKSYSPRGEGTRSRCFRAPFKQVIVRSNESSYRSSRCEKFSSSSRLCIRYCM